MIEIEINNLTENLFDENRIKNAVLSVLDLEKERLSTIFNLSKEKEINSFLSIVIVGPRRMKKFNKQYRNKNKVTDVLSFSIMKDNADNKFIDPTNSLGEIIICPKYIKKILKREEKITSNKIDFNKRFLEVLIHGVYHLLGYNHSQQEKLKIRRGIVG